MPSLKNIILLGFKEFRSLSRDRVMVAFIVFAFTGAIYSSATGIPETLSKAPLAIVDEDRSQLSAQIISAFQPPYFLSPKIIDHNEMDRGMDAGEYTFTLDIPPNFEKELLAHRSPQIQLNVDATQITQAFSGVGYIQSIVQAELTEYISRERQEQVLPINLNMRIAFNPNLVQAWFGAVIEVINNITMLAMILTGAALIREREHGTIEHLLVMPVTAFEIMMAKIWSMGLVVQVAAMFSLQVVVRGWLNTPLNGSLWLFFLATTAHMFATTSLGIFLATIARTMPQFGLLSIMVIIPLEMLSGGNTPLENMPVPIQRIMLFAPSSHFVRIAKAILFRGADFSIVWIDFLAIVVIGIFLIFLTLLRFRKTLAML